MRWGAGQLMKELGDAEKARMWEEVREEFPDDPMMQELHYIRLVQQHQIEGLSPQERVQFYERAAARRQ
ncbi:MAG: hypothetical protein BWZ09_02608 [Alphaproteobacteria bacterium ADurb.BinA305]|nr:MAG: hypothetical protein BWZ09_02608 [Alphaproteobacteria bacterium ADurb.BinA305]